MRLAVAIGPAGEVYEPDGKGAWIRRTRLTTSRTISLAARAGGAIVALGDGVVYRLASNGWSAIRLAQKDTARLSVGARAVAAVGRQLFALDALTGGEPTKLGAATGDILLFGSGATIAIATARGLFRINGGKLAPIKSPRPARMLVGDQWAIVEGGAIELRTGKLAAWPAGLAVEVATTGPDDRLIAVARGADRRTLEVMTVRAGKVERAPIELAPTGVPVGVAADRAGRAVIAFRDGRLAVRGASGAGAGAGAPPVWTTVLPVEQLPAARPGSPPAPSR